MSDSPLTSSLRAQVAQGWPSFLPALFDEPMPGERRATCENCAMCAPSTGAPAQQAQGPSLFHPNTKCCTYHPWLPSFMVGALLSDLTPELAEGKRRVRARIAEQHGVTPHGVDGAPAYWQRYLATKDAFGRTQDLLCPYYSEGMCTVWHYREAVCATYYCKHDQGDDGHRFWMAVRDYLLELSRALTTHAMLELGFNPEEALAATSNEITSEELDREPLPAAVYRARWRHYAGREEDYYCDAHAVISQLAREQVEAVAGVRLRALLQHLTALYHALRKPLIPSQLKRNPSLRIEREPSGGYVVEAYSSSDPSRLPQKLYQALDAFDGRPSAEVVAQLKAEGRAFPSESLLRGLFHHRVLIEAVSPEEVTSGDHPSQN